MGARIKKHIKEWPVVTPQKPWLLAVCGMLIMFIMYAFAIYQGITEHVSGMQTVCNVLCCCGTFGASLYLISKRWLPRLNLLLRKIVHLSPLVCAVGEGLYSAYLFTDLIYNKIASDAIVSTIFTSLSGIVACLMYVYILAYYNIYHDDDDLAATGKSPITTRVVILCFITILGIVNTIGSLISYFASTPGDAFGSVGVIVGVLATAVIAYYPWFCMVAGEHYADADITRQAARRSAIRARKKRERAELRYKLAEFWGVVTKDPGYADRAEAKRHTVSPRTVRISRNNSSRRLRHRK